MRFVYYCRRLLPHTVVFIRLICFIVDQFLFTDTEYCVHFMNV